jgi:hypothetical protein
MRGGMMDATDVLLTLAPKVPKTRLWGLWFRRPACARLLFRTHREPVTVPTNVDLHRGFAFVHIPKNAGTSINRSLGIPCVGHHTAAALRRVLGKAYDELLSFAVVRNPWDRFVSNYFYARMPESLYHSTMPGSEKARNIYYDMLTNASLLDCARLLAEGKFDTDHQHWNHWRPQTYWLRGDDGRTLVKRLIRFEQLERDLDALGKELGIRFDVPHLNRTDRPTRSYAQLLDRETAKLVADYYRSDIEMFDYAF